MPGARRILGLVAVAAILAGAWTPAVACLLMPAASLHGCCAPATAVQKDCAPGLQTCCVIEQRDQSPVITARYEVTRSAPAATLLTSADPAISHFGSAASMTAGSSPPGAPPGLASVLRI